MQFLSRLFGKGAGQAKIDNNLVIWLEDLPAQSAAIAGGKGASLGDMTRAGLPVPSGFIVPTHAFRTFLAEVGGAKVILQIMGGVDVHTESQLRDASAAVRDFILSKPMPKTLHEDIRRAYAQLGANAPVAVRSSAASEDSDAASFAGQQETFLNVRGADSVIDRVRECWASFFTPRAIFYRAQKGSLEDSEMAVVVQKMVQAEKSGVMFTVDPVQGRKDQMVIEAVYGLGEAVVSGKVTPDHYVVDRAHATIVREHVAFQTIALVYNEMGGTREVQLSELQGSTRVLTDEEIRQLHKLGLKLEGYFGKPQDIEWAIEGSELYLLQSRAVTTL